TISLVPLIVDTALDYSLFSLLLYCSAHHRNLHSFPTRPSSDLKLVPACPCSRKVPSPPSAAPARTLAAVRCSRSASKATQSTQRSEEHTSELQSRGHLVCRLLLEKKKQQPA